MKRWGLIAFAIGLVAAAGILLYVYRFDLGLESRSSEQNTIVSDEILFYIEHEQSLFPRTSLNRLVRVVDRSLGSKDYSEDSNKVLRDTFESINVAFTINPNAYDPSQIYYGVIYANSLYDASNPNTFESYYDLIELGTLESDPLVSVKIKDVPAKF